MNNLVLFISGLVLLYSYYRLGKNTPYVDKLWGKIDGNFRNVYIYSIFISALPFLITVYYINFDKKLDQKIKNNIYLGLLSIVLFSIFWMPLSILYLIKKEDKCMIRQLVIFTLFLVAASAFYVLNELKKIDDNSLLYKSSFYGMCYFFFHVFVLDFISWSYNFFI
tara:strand:+ start:3272 stop:3769 length:498 start_codon:yes stop_codon:yes gene_type:complete